MRRATYYNERKLARKMKFSRRSELLQHIRDIGDVACLNDKELYDLKLQEYLGCAPTRVPEEVDYGEAEEGRNANQVFWYIPIT